MFPATVKVKDEFKHHGEKISEIRHEILKENYEILVNDYESLELRFKDIEDTNKITKLQLEKRTSELEENDKKIVEEMKRSETETKARINDLMTLNKELLIEKAKEKEEFENKIDELEKKLIDMIESKHSSMKTDYEAQLVSDSTSYGDKSLSDEAMEDNVENKSSINAIVISDGSESEGDNLLREMSRKRQRFDYRNQEQKKSVEQLLRCPGREHLPILHPKHLPGTIWFDTDSSIVRQITKIICADFKEPHANWSQTTYETRKRWFIAFVQKYNWKVGMTGVIQKKFNEYGASRLRGQVSTWRTTWKKKGDNAKPIYMTDIIWTGLVKYWTDPKSIHKSAIASRSRLSDRDGLGPHKHTSGSKSFDRVRKEMELETGETPSILRVLEMTHKSKTDGVFVDSRAKQIHEQINAKISKKSTQELTQAEIDDIYLKSVTPRKGRTYGLGSIYGVGSSSVRAFDFSSWKDRTDPKNSRN